MAYLSGAKVNSSELLLFTATYDAASLATVTARDDAITVTGVRFQDDQSNPIDKCVAAHQPDAVAQGIYVANCRVTADNQITVRLVNPTAGSVDLASGTWSFYVARY